MASSTAFRVLGRLREDLPLYAERCLKIRGKSGEIVPLRLNRAQLFVHQRLEAQRARTGKVRALILKARQQGFSTYIGARFYHRASLNRGLRVFILTHERAATDNLFGMVERFHRLGPLSPATGAANARALYFDRLDSGYAVGTAGSKAVGRSATIQLFHGSEVAFWPNAAEHFAGVVQTVPDHPGTECILESTANGVGGEFHARWTQAVAGLSDYEAIFTPWFWSDEYRRTPPDAFTLDPEEAGYAALHGLDLGQMAWRRAKMAELKDPVTFAQEYPATADEAFQTSGRDSFIAAADVLRARKATLAAEGPLVVGVDPKREGSDRFAIAWRQGRRLLKVEADAAPIDTIRAAAKLKDIIDRDGPARVFIDVGGGAGIFDILASWGAPYDRIVRLVNFGAKPIGPARRDAHGRAVAGPKNRRAEMWSLSRDWLSDEGGADLPDLDALQADATAPGYRYDPVSQALVLEAKEEIRRRGLPSPDLWDAVALTFAEPVQDPSRRRPLDLPNLGIV